MNTDPCTLLPLLPPGDHEQISSSSASVSPLQNGDNATELMEMS